MTSFFFSNHCRNVDEVKKRCDYFLTKNRFIYLQICSTIQFNLFQNSLNHVDVQWVFVEIYNKFSSMFNEFSSKFNEFSSFNKSSFMFNNFYRCSTNHDNIYLIMSMFIKWVNVRVDTLNVASVITWLTVMSTLI